MFADELSWASTRANPMVKVSTHISPSKVISPFRRGIKAM